MPHLLTKQQFQEIYAKVPRLCVDVVIIQAGQILLTKRSIEPFWGLWHIPGGTVYFGETLEQTVQRVAKEELGLNVNPGQVLGVVTAPDEFKGDWHGWPMSIEVQATVLSGKPTLDNSASEVKFFSQLPIPMVDCQRQFLIQKLGFKEEVAEK